MHNKAKQIDTNFLHELNLKYSIAKSLFKKNLPTYYASEIADIFMDDIVFSNLFLLLELFEILNAHKESFVNSGKTSISLKYFDFESIGAINLYNTLVDTGHSFIPILGDKLCHDTEYNSMILDNIPGMDCSTYKSYEYRFYSTELDNYIDTLKRTHSKWDDSIVTNDFFNFLTVFHPYDGFEIYQAIIVESDSPHHYKNYANKHTGAQYKYNVYFNAIFHELDCLYEVEEHTFLSHFLAAIEFYKKL